MSNYFEFPTNQFIFELNGTIADGQWFWEPHDRYDMIVPLHHFTVDVGWHQYELEDLVSSGLQLIPEQYSRDSGAPLSPKSEVLDTKGHLYVSTLYRPYVVPTEAIPKEGDEIDHREVRVTGNLGYDDGVLFARCNQIEFKALPEPFTIDEDEMVSPGAENF